MRDYAYIWLKDAAGAARAADPRGIAGQAAVQDRHARWMKVGKSDGEATRGTTNAPENEPARAGGSAHASVGMFATR